MKILFVEDTPQYIQEFLKQLNILGEVITFKSVRNTILWLDEHGSSIDLVVCDHNILRWEDDSRSKAQGFEIYHELRLGEINPTVPFIHFSADPCPEEYDASKDTNFYSIKKESHTNLIAFIEKKGLKK